MNQTKHIIPNHFVHCMIYDGQINVPIMIEVIVDLI